MSLINQMLKDLEKRSTQTVQPDALLTGLEITRSKKNKWKMQDLLYWVVLLFIVLGLGSVGHYYRIHHPLLSKQQNAPRAKLIINPVPVTAPIQQRTINQESSGLAALTGISMQTHGKVTYLRFLLSHEVFYQIHSDPLEHSITITLKDTRLAVNVPPLDYSPSALSKVKIVSEQKGQLSVVFLLKPAAKLNNLELNKEGPYPELQADFLLETTVPLQKAGQPQQEEWTVVPPLGLKKTAVELSGDERYEQALQLAEHGAIEQAIRLLAVVLDQDPSHHAAREALITLLIQQGNRQEAQVLLAKGLQLQPYYPPFMEVKAHFLVDEGKIAQALQMLKKAPPALAAYPEYYAFIAALYQRLGQLAAAENLYQQLTVLHPEKGAWWLGLGVTKEGLGKNAQALEAYTKADRSPDLDPELRGYISTRLRG